MLFETEIMRETRRASHSMLQTYLLWPMTIILSLLSISCISVICTKVPTLWMSLILSTTSFSLLKMEVI